MEQNQKTERNEEQTGGVGFGVSLVSGLAIGAFADHLINNLLSKKDRIVGSFTSDPDIVYDLDPEYW